MLRSFLAALLLWWVLSPALAGAASFHLAPVRLTLSADRSTAALTITGNDSGKRTLQLDVVSWHQRQGEDIYEPTDELLVTPPIMELQPGESRIIRVGLHHAAAADKEAAYRLYIREVPPPPEPGFKGVRVVLNIGVPVFVLPKAPVSSELHWQARRLAGGGVQLELANRGKAHAQITELRLAEKGGGKSKSLAGGACYLLAGETRHWLIPPRQAARLPHGRLHLFVVTDQGKQEIGLDLKGQ